VDFIKKLSVIISLLILTQIPGNAGAEKKIGVVMFSEYADTLKGIRDELNKAGYNKSRVKYIIENAEVSKAKAVMIAGRFSRADLDLIFSLGTTATVTITREIKDTPIVICMVYDPVLT